MWAHDANCKLAEVGREREQSGIRDADNMWTKAYMAEARREQFFSAPPLPTDTKAYNCLMKAWKCGLFNLLYVNEDGAHKTRHCQALKTYEPNLKSTSYYDSHNFSPIHIKNYNNKNVVERP